MQLHFKITILDENKTLSDNNVKYTDVSEPTNIGLTLRLVVVLKLFILSK